MLCNARAEARCLCWQSAIRRVGGAPLAVTLWAGWVVVPQLLGSVDCEASHVPSGNSVLIEAVGCSLCVCQGLQEIPQGSRFSNLLGHYFLSLELAHSRVC